MSFELHCLKKPFCFRTLPLNIRDFEKILWSANSDCLKFAAVEMNESWADDLEVLSAAVKLFIEKATNQDWTLRVGWLNQIKKNLAEVPGKYQLLPSTDCNVCSAERQPGWMDSWLDGWMHGCILS